MKIQNIACWTQSIELARPYQIATRTVSEVELGFIRLRGEDGSIGLGSASPARQVTGESPAACWAALNAERLAWLQGEDARRWPALCRRLGDELVATPAARVAVEMALADLLAKSAGVAVADLLGRCQSRLPTSITIGIKPDIEEALDEADEYLARGFRCLKVKIGLDLEYDLEVLRRLRDRIGREVSLRVDANQGYDLAALLKLAAAAAPLGLELIEQPVPTAQFRQLHELPEELRRIIAADESLLGEGDAVPLLQHPLPCGIFNIKLMKCGGLTSAAAIARMAQAAGIDLMWGCMDESVISISAALHLAYACPNTRYLDLDGSFDLATDPARGGFSLESGALTTLAKPGLGVEFST